MLAARENRIIVGSDDLPKTLDVAFAFRPDADYRSRQTDGVQALGLDLRLLASLEVLNDHEL